MTTASGTNDFDSMHAVTEVFDFRDLASVYTVVERGPTTMGIIFGGRLKENFTTSCTPVSAQFLVVPIFTSKWAFSAFITQDVKLLGS